MRLYGFFQGKPLNILEDAAHIFIGLVPMLGWLREHWQWPPGDTIWLNDEGGLVDQEYDGAEAYAPHDRGADAYRDGFGYAIGGTIRFVVLVGLVIWKW